MIKNMIKMVENHPMNSETTDFKSVKFHIRTGSRHFGNLTKVLKLGTSLSNQQKVIHSTWTALYMEPKVLIQSPKLDI